MARYLVDTNTLIDYSKGFEPAASRIQRMIGSQEDLGICGVQLTEFFTGVPPSARPRWEQFFECFSLWEISRSAAIQAGIDRYGYARRGLQLSTVDCLTAAVAREHAAILVTRNVKDFPMPDLELLSLHS